jgi:hypothetical protein
MKAKEFIPQSKPRNFVAKNQKTAGAGAHKDKKRAEKQGDVKHKQKQFEQGVAEVSKATIDRYVSKASDAHGDADFAARMSKHDPDKRSYHVDQKKTAEKRRQGISRALDRMSRPQGVAEVKDSNFVGFMNKTLGQKVDSPTAKSTMPDFMKDAPVAGLDSMGYKAALNFGMKTLNKLTPTQKTKLAIKGENGVVNWLESQARKQGLLVTDEDDTDDQDENPTKTPNGKFSWEDLDEVQDFLSEIFKDPAITSWALVLTDGEPLPKEPVVGPFTIEINPGIPGENGYANADWKELDTLENLPDAKELAQGLAKKNPKQFIGISDAKGKSAGFYWPGKGWSGLREESVAEARQSVAVKLAKAWDQQKAKSAASRERAKELLNPAKKDQEKKNG